MSIRITCIKKSSGFHSNPYTAIEALGWTEDSTNKKGITSRLEMYDWVREGNHAYVNDARGNSARLICAETPGGTRYVKTVADETKDDNLLSLAEC